MENVLNKRFSIITSEPTRVLIPMIQNKVIELFKKAGVDMPLNQMVFKDEYDNFHLHLRVFNRRPVQSEDDKKMIGVAHDLGFSDDGYGNMKLILEHIYQTPLEHVLNSHTMVLIMEFYQESAEIMSRINRIYDDIDNMTADETKRHIAYLYTRLKNQYGWSE